MMDNVKMMTFDSREEWLVNRSNYIGGSDAAVIMGVNPWKTSTELWNEKTGRVQAKDISDSAAVRYGIAAEDLLRELFKLDYPEYDVQYVPNNSFINPEYDFAAASLDGWIIDEDGKLGILEIKTGLISGSAQKAKWEGRIPDNYYCQVLFYMAVTNADFAILKAQLKYDYDGEEPWLVTKHYRIERSEAEDDIKLLMQRCRQFYEYIKTDTYPPLYLNI